MTTDSTSSTTHTVAEIIIAARSTVPSVARLSIRARHRDTLSGSRSGHLFHSPLW